MTDARIYYVRFVIGLRDEDSHLSQGIFQAAYLLLDSSQIEIYEHELLTQCLDWFDKHIEPPDCLDDQGTERAICWFHPKAKDAIERVRQIAQILGEHGQQVRMLTTDQPGKIAYEDGYQVFAYPYRDQRDNL